MTIHDETAHPRNTRDGRFTDKAQTVPEMTLNPSSELTPPGGDTELRLEQVFADGSQFWRASESRYAEVDADGSATWFRDGDISRKGGPAVVRADGRELWYDNGTLLENPRPAPPTTVVDKEAGTTTVTGSRFDENHAPRNVAALIRNDIRLAERAGTVESLGVDFAVRTSGRQGGEQTIHVTATMPGHRLRRLPVGEFDPTNPPSLSDEALAIREALWDLGTAYARDVVTLADLSLQTNYRYTVTLQSE